VEADNIAVCIFVRFAGRDNPSGRRGLHLVGGPVRCDGGHAPAELSQDEADPKGDTCRGIVGLTRKTS
jgi:hypothetical protein